MAGFEIVKRAMLKLLMKKGDDGIMLTLPKNEIVDLNTRITMDRLIKAGIDPNSLTSPEQVINVLNNIANANKPKVIPGTSAEGRAITEKLFGKKGEVVEFPQKRSFAEEIEAMKKSGDLVDADDVKISEKITDREMFKNSNLNKKDSVTETISYIKTLKPMDAMKEANSVIGRKGKYKNLTQEESKKILNDTEDHIFERDIPDEDFAQGGRAGHYTGGMVDVEPSLSDIGHGSDSLMARTRLVSPGNQATTSTGLNYLLAEDNDNLRVPFSDGEFVDEALAHYNQYLASRKARPPKKRYKEIPFLKFFEEFSKENRAEGGRIGFAAGTDLKRRAFMKLIAALTGGAAAVKSGILSLGGKSAAKKTLIPITTSNAPGKPAWFDPLITRVLREGDDVTKTMSTKEREIVHRKKIDNETEITVTQDLDNNITRVDIDDATRNVTGFDDPPTVSLQVTGEIVEEGGQRTKPKFEAMENDYRNYATDPDGGYETEFVENVVDNTKDLTSDLTKIKSFATKKGPTMKEIVGSKKRRNNVKYANEKTSSYAADRGPDFDPTDYIDDMADDMATGGRAGFATGKLAQVSGRKFLEKVFGKDKFKTMIDNDPELEQGMLEVVNMFRKKDKEGLKMYLQKYLPHMDDATIEDFIIGGQGTEGIEGQLIRLGSGRDYKGKIDMIDEANNVRKLEEFDIDGVSKNAEGGRIGFSGGGILRAIISKSAAKAGMKPYQYIKATSYKSLPPEVKMFMSKADFEQLKIGQEQMYSNYIDMMQTRLNFQKNIEGGKTTPARELFEGMEKTMDEQSLVPKNVTADDIAEVELMVKNRFNKGRKDNARGGLQNHAR